MTSEVCDRESLLRAEEICRENGFVWDECFESEADFFSFGSVYKNYFYSAQASLEYKKSFFSKFGSYFEGRAATFDIGYSCRVESILKKTFGFDVTPFYIHINNDYALTRAFQCGIDIKTFYNSEPGITGLPRELLISKIEGSLTCYEKDGDELKPVFAPLEYNRSAEKIIRRIQSSALQYCEDLMKTFGSDLKYLYYQREDVSLPLEWFLFNPKEADRELFGIIEVEDDIGITKGGFSYNQYWDMQRAGVSSDGMASPERLCSYEWGMWAKIRPRFLQAIVLWKVDRALLKEKVCGKLSGHPLILNPIRFVYKSARFFYRKIRGAGKGGKS